MDTVFKTRHGAFYPFRYYVKWEMSKKRTEFGEILTEKWNAICEAVAKEDEIFLDAFYMTSAFDCVYFFLWSIPKLAPLDVVDIVKIGVYNIMTNKYPQLREELLHDVWYPIDKRQNYSKMDYIAYFYRFDVKFSTNILYRQMENKKVKDIVKEEISHAVESYNKRNEKPIEILMSRCAGPHSVELIIGCPITVSASSVIGPIKGSSSYSIKKKYSQFSDRDSPYFVYKEGFWGPSNFFAISRHHVESISRDKSRYIKLRDKWKNLKKESDRNKKGKLLELFMEDMIQTMNNFEILRDENGNYDINLGFEQIDLTIKNRSKILERFGSLFKIECKNWKDVVGNAEIRDFSGKLRGEIRLGILISVNGFGKYKKEIIERLYFHDKKIIITITGDEIEKWLNGIITGFNDGASERSDFEMELENKIFHTYINLT